MKRIIDTFKSMSTKQRVLSITATLIALAVIVLAILQIFDVLSWAACIYLPLSAVLMLIQAYSANKADPKANRGTVILSLISAGIVLLCGIGVIVIELIR